MGFRYLNSYMLHGFPRDRETNFIFFELKSETIGMRGVNISNYKLNLHTSI